MRFFSGLLLALGSAALLSCVDDTAALEGEGTTTTGTGELVLFRAGCTSTTTTTRADAKTYYMPETSRFVARMYYKSHEGMEEFDVSLPTDAWLLVNNSTGNSVYWNQQYETRTADQLDTHGNDNGNDVAYFYWQNRRPHAFLAWTDYNRMQDDTFKYSNELKSGMLKFSPHDEIITTNEVSNVWMDTGYQLYGLKDDEGNDLKFSDWADLKEYVEANGESNDFKSAQNFQGTEDFSSASFYYEYGWSCKYYVAANAEVIENGDTRTSGWIKYLMYYEKFLYEPTGDEQVEKDSKTDIPAFLKDAFGNYLAAIEYDADDEALEHPHYYKTDINGNIRYDEEKPKFTFYMKRTSQLKHDMVVQSQYRANVFDLTRGSKEKMADQPDILQALTLQAPTSATLQANRVDLYFKHQFSQIQVNIKNSDDNSVTVKPEQVLKVELLGVTEQGYVFTELERNGTVRASTYKEVVATDYTNEELEANPYGTSFDMFEREIPADEKETTGAIKSYEAIAFGLLQAIRITWKEEDIKMESGTKQEGVIHEATYRVPEANSQNEPLRTLQSGIKYIWNIELRRGTLAVIRTEIIPWVLNEETYSADGTIVK